MTRSPARILAAVFCLLACSALPVLHVSAWDPCSSWAHPQLDFAVTVFPTETFPVTVQLNASYTTRSDEPIVVWQWDFGDGTTDSIVREEMTPGWQSTRHVYTALRDTVEVCAEGTTNCGITGHRCRQVAPHCTAPRAGFTVNVTEGPAPLAVAITDTSEHTPGGATTWAYTKDGGGGFSTISRTRDFRGTLTEPGDYTITQTVKKDCSPRSDSFSRRIRVTSPAHGTVYETGGTPPVTTLAIVGMFLNLSNVTVPATTPSSVTPEPAGTLPAGMRVTTPLSPAPAPSPLPAPGTGTLSVTTDPPGAEVLVDDILRGASPVSVPGLIGGSHTLRLRKSGYKESEVTIRITPPEETKYSAVLVPVSPGTGRPLPLTVPTAILAVAGACAMLCCRNRKKIA